MYYGKKRFPKKVKASKQNYVNDFERKPSTDNWMSFKRMFKGWYQKGSQEGY